MLGTMSHTKKAALVFLLYAAMVTLGSWTLLAMSARAQPTTDDSTDAVTDAGPTAALDVREVETGPESGSDRPETSPSGEDDGLLVVVGKGDTAPFSGLLLRDKRFAELKLAELRVDNAEYEAKTEKQTREKLEVVLDSCLQDEDSGGGFFDSFWGGMAVGVGAAILVGWLGYKILDEEGG